MACRAFVVALTMIAATSPVSASQPEQIQQVGAPSAEPGARYCLWIEAVTGTRLETIMCETREGWANLGVNLDEEWPKEGVRVIGPARTING